MDKKKAQAAIDQFSTDCLLATHPYGTVAQSQDIECLISAIKHLAQRLVDSLD